MAKHSLSVVITCYNGWKYMNNCLEYFEKQTVSPDELVIVDDCSTDESYQELKRYAETSKIPVKLLRNEVNRGPGYSRRIGVEHSQGEYVAFCDCDDWYETNFVKTVKTLAEKECFDLLIYDNYVVYEDGKKLKKNATAKLFNASKKKVLALYAMSLCRLAVKREVLNRVKHSELYYAEDAVVAVQIIEKADKITVLEDAFYNYLYRQGSASTRPSPKVVPSFVRAYEIMRGAVSEEYVKELEFIGIKTVCYGATLNAFKIGMPVAEIRKIMRSFSDRHKSWFENPYLPTLGKAKKMYLFLISKRLFFLAGLMAKSHNKIVELLKKTA